MYIPHPFFEIFTFGRVQGLFPEGFENAARQGRGHEQFLLGDFSGEYGERPLGGWKGHRFSGGGENGEGEFG